MTDLYQPAGDTHAPHIDIDLTSDDFRVMFEQAWSDNVRLREALLVRETVLRRLIAENTHLRRIVGEVNDLAERLAEPQTAENEPILADPGPSSEPPASQ